jgi:hypothetical protein
MTLVEGVIERRLEHGEHTIGGGAAGPSFLRRGRCGPKSRLAALRSALGGRRRHGGQPPAQLLGGQFGHHEIAEARQDMHGAAADGVLNGLPFVVLELDVAIHGLAHGEALDRAAAVRRRDHGAGLGGGLLERQHLHAIRRDRVVGEPSVVTRYLPLPM